MKNKLSTLLLLILIIITGASYDASGQKSPKKDRTARSAKGSKNTEVKLFNGKDLSNWVFHLKDPAVDPSTVFTVRNGVINISGDPFGYMRTRDAYSDYRLHVEWRYPGELSNSGVFVHSQTPDTIWLKCFECQLHAGDAGGEPAREPQLDDEKSTFAGKRNTAYAEFRHKATNAFQHGAAAVLMGPVIDIGESVDNVWLAGVKNDCPSNWLDSPFAIRLPGAGMIDWSENRVSVTRI